LAQNFGFDMTVIFWFGAKFGFGANLAWPATRRVVATAAG